MLVTAFFNNFDTFPTNITPKGKHDATVRHSPRLGSSVHFLGKNENPQAEAVPEESP